MQIGDNTGPATVTATSLKNTGTLSMFGEPNVYASLNLSGAATKTLTGVLQLYGYSTIQFGSGEITTIGSGAELLLGGASAQILTNGGASSALSDLTANFGVLELVGNIYGVDGVTLTTTKSFTNYNIVDVDAGGPSSPGAGGGGSAVTFGGTLTNDASFTIGTTELNAATTVTAKALNNSCTISLDGSPNGTNGFLAELIVNGAATTDGTVSIGAGAEIDVTGPHAFTQTGGLTAVTGSLLAGTINANGGALDFESADHQRRRRRCAQYRRIGNSRIRCCGRRLASRPFRGCRRQLALGRPRQVPWEGGELRFFRRNRPARPGDHRPGLFRIDHVRGADRYGFGRNNREAFVRRRLHDVELHLRARRVWWKQHPSHVAAWGLNCIVRWGCGCAFTLGLR